MQALDNDFFELYKRLDNCCRDIYSSRNGVSEYIVQMEQYTSGKYRVYAWDEDYKMLKHLRWIRNQIAHDSRGFSFCQPQDIKALQNFYNRLLSGQDPLALLRKSMKSETQKKRAKNKPCAQDPSEKKQHFNGYRFYCYYRRSYRGSCIPCPIFFFPLFL